MTRTHSNIALLLIAAALAPSIVFAEEMRPMRMQGGAPVQNAFCATLDREATRLTALSDGRGRETREGIEKRLASIADRRDTRLAERTENINARIQKIGARATTDEQRAAVQTFQTTVSAALLEKDRQVTAALQKFRTDAALLVETRTRTVTTAQATLKSSLDAALQKAKTDCAANVDPRSVRETFRASVASALESFKTATKEKRDIRADLEALRKTRDESVRVAQQGFKTAFDAALVTLRTVLPN